MYRVPKSYILINVHTIEGSFDQPDLYGKVETYEDPKTGDMVQVHEESGMIRWRVCPSFRRPFPQYRDWFLPEGE